MGNVSNPHAQPPGWNEIEALDRVVRDAAVKPVFQPIVDLRSGSVSAYEALTRVDPGTGFKHPGALFDAAERSGRLWDLEMITRRAALRAAQEWPPGVLMFMNSTPQVFADPRFPETFESELMQCDGLSAGRVVLEITERSEQQVIDGLSENLQRLRSLGCQVAIDDVGAGTSGLNRIVTLRPQWLKLDRELIDGIAEDGVAQHLVRFVFSFARMSGVSLIAEGIEQQRDLDVLIEMGIPYAQGYLLGRPAPREEIQATRSAEAIQRASERARLFRFNDPREVRLASIARGVVTGAITDTVASLGIGAAEADVVAVVVDGARMVGYVPATRVVEAVRSGRGETRLGMLAAPAPTTLDSSATFLDALEVCAARDDEEAATPLVLTEGAVPVGVLTVQDLLRLASRVCESVELRSAPLTGLPGRVRCEQHLAELCAASGRSAIEPRDVAFVDLRRFREYNARYGFDLGDQIIRGLAGVIIGFLEERRIEGWFVGHLSDDRFMVTAPCGTLGSIAERIASRFEGEARHLSEAAARRRSSSVDDPATPQVRIMIYEDAIRRAGTPNEVLGAEDMLRRLADEHARDKTSGGHRSVFVYRAGDRQRLSA